MQLEILAYCAGIVPNSQAADTSAAGKASGSIQRAETLGEMGGGKADEEEQKPDKRIICRPDSGRSS